MGLTEDFELTEEIQQKQQEEMESQILYERNEADALEDWLVEQAELRANEQDWSMTGQEM